MNSCPTHANLVQLLEGSLSDNDSAELESHLGECTLCEQAFQDLANTRNSDWESWKALLSHTPEDEAATGEPGIAREQLRTHFEQAGFSEIEEVGRGGMSIVFRARQIALDRQVAIKVLAGGNLASPDRVERMLIEARAVGKLKHPNIVGIYLAEKFERTPYLVLEYVDGGDLATRIASGPLPARMAAEIAADIASALDHAHQAGIVHRDVKPGNVLFDGQQTRLADFGLAKFEQAQSEVTATGTALGTPAYMSPEQARGESEAVTPATDVYALGVVLYEMLCAVTPFRSASPIETLRMIDSQEPVALRKIQPKLDRDLETICLKCLEKSPADRYSSAAALLSDLQRFLDGKPIKAKPTSVFRKSAKWMARHPALSLVSGVCLIAIATLLGVWINFTSELAEQRNIAVNSANAAAESLSEQIESNVATQEVLQFFTQDMFFAAAPENEGIELTVVDVLDDAAESLDSRFKDRPKVEAAVRAAVGNTYYHLGKTAESLPHLERSVALYAELDDDALQEAEFDARHSLALCLKEIGQRKEARTMLEELLQESEELDRERNLEVRFTYSNILLRDSDLGEATQYVEELLLDCEEVLGTEHSTTLGVYGQLGVIHFKHGDFESAVEVFQKQLAGFEATVGSAHPDTVTAVNNLAIGLVRLGKLAEAEQMHRQNLAAKMKVLGAGHYSTIGTMNNLAMVIWRQERFDEASELQYQVVLARRSANGATDRGTLEAVFQLGRMYFEMKEYEKGVQLFEEVIVPVFESREVTGQWTSLILTEAQLRIGAGASREAVASLLEIATENLEEPSVANPSRKKMLADTLRMLD